MISTRPTHVHQRIIVVTALMLTILYLHRFCISFAEIYIKEDLGLSDSQVGVMMGAFFATYALAQVPSGWLSDRFGGRIMLTLYILLWSLFTGLTGFAGVFLALLCLRFGVGVAQAGAYPTAAGLISHWAPLSARGLASSVVALGGRLGAFVAPVLSAYVILLFTPVTASSLLTPGDLLNAPRLSYEILHGPYSSKSPQRTDRGAPAAKAGQVIFERLSPDARQAVAGGAAWFADAEAARLVAQAEGSPEKDKPLAPHAGELARLKEQLAAELNRMQSQPPVLGEDDLRQLPLEKEGQALLNRLFPPLPLGEGRGEGPGFEDSKKAEGEDSLTPNELSRLNRLVLEWLYPGSIRKVYGRGWRPMMWTYGAAGVLIVLAYWWIVRNRPAEHPRCNELEQKSIARGRPKTAAGKVGRAPIGRLLVSPSIWLNCLYQILTNIGWVFVVTWLPRYLVDVHEVPAQLRGWMTATPMLAAMLGMFLGGKLTDIMSAKFGLRWGRALPMSLSRFVGAAAYVMCLFEPSPWLAVAAFSLVAFSTDLGVPAVWAFQQDVGGRYVGSVLGWGNMWGNLGAMATPLVLIWLVEKHSWNAAFLVCGGAFAIAGLAALGINAARPVIVERDASPEG